MSKRECPTLRGEELYVPFVGAIIQRTLDNGNKQILVQTRCKSSDAQYNGRLEIPGGKLKAFEDIYQTIRREVEEECGLEITCIMNENRRIDYRSREDVSSLIEPFCVTQMQNGPCIGFIFICEAIGKPAEVTDEARDAKWIDIEELANIVLTTPESVYTPFLGPLKKYFAYIFEQSPSFKS